MFHQLIVQSTSCLGMHEFHAGDQAEKGCTVHNILVKKVMVRSVLPDIRDVKFIGWNLEVLLKHSSSCWVDTPAAQCTGMD